MAHAPQVLSVDRQDVTGLGLSEVRRRLAGPPGKPVLVTLAPGPESRAHYLALRRAVISGAGGRKRERE